MATATHIQINEALFAEAYESYWKELFITCNRYVNDTEVAKGIVQEVFISVWERREIIIIHTSLKSYLHSALKFKVLEHYRKQTVRENYVVHKLNTTSTEHNHTTEDHLFHKELYQALNMVVNSLPERCRQVYLMSREQGMNNRAIAAELVITEKAVEGNITRALSFIRSKLKVFKQ